MVEKLLKKVLAGEEISSEEALQLVTCDLTKLKQGAELIRKHYCGDTFDLCSIINGKSGRCSENCKYCGQSRHYQTDVAVYDLLTSDEIKKQALYNQERGVKRFSIVTAGRSLNDQEFADVLKTYQELHDTTNISLCASLGLLDVAQFKQLKAVGVKRYHNNLETSRNYFSSICTTHSYEQKITTIKAAKLAGLEVCSGGIMGMGESWQDRIDLAFELKNLGIQSVPINILNPIKGTPLADTKVLSQAEIERIFAVYRFILPRATLRMAGGRGLLKDKGISVFKSGANGAITGDMLTTQGITISDDQKIIKKLGFKVIDKC